MPGYANPQSLNRYSYVNNSPLNYTDPSGHMLCAACAGEGGGFTPQLPPPLKDGVDICKTPRSCPGQIKSLVPPVDPSIINGGYDYGDGHPGVDLNPDSIQNPNPAVVASSYGMVYSATACSIDPCVGGSLNANAGYGNVVIIGYDYTYLPQEVQALIPDGTTLFMLYAHLESPSNLQAGELVEPGQIIGNVGNTGNSGGAHLHMEIRIWSGQGESLPVGPMHIADGPDIGFTDVHTVWHTWMEDQNPHDFFEID